jgi:NAD(P)-dependent dehydrogenase (short-subunit alcohol dehydrogenase family)
MKTAIITGARSEIARAAAVSMAKSGARVVLVSSSASAAAARDEVVKLSGSSDIHLLLADVSLMSSVRELARQIGENWNSISAIVHHGVHHNIRASRREVTPDGFERFWAHNHLGPFLLTHLLKEQLIKGHGHVVTIGSTRLGAYPRMTVYADDPNFEHRSFSSIRAFLQSKLAQIQFALALQRHWKTTAVVSKALAVPSVGADVGRRAKLPWYRRLAHQTTSRKMLSPRRIGDLYAVVALSPKMARLAAGYIDVNFEEAWAPAPAFDAAAQDVTWATSVRQLGL